MKEKLGIFFNSYLFIGITFLIAVVNWAVGTFYIALPYYIVSIILIILFDIKRINIVTILLAGIISFIFSSMKENAILVAIGGGALLPFIIYDVVKQKINFKNSTLVGMFIVFLSILCSARFAIESSFALIGIVQYLSYLIIFSYALIVCQGDSKYNQEYIAKVMVFLGVAIAIELSIYAFRIGDLSFIEEKDIQLGWGFSNSISFIYLIIIFFTLYLYLINQKRWYLLLFMILYFYLIVILQSRSVWGIGFIVSFPTFGWLIYKSENRKKISLVIASVVGVTAILGVLFVLFSDLFIVVNARFEAQALLNLKDRMPIYYKGMEIFQKYPIYGAGVFTSSYYLNPAGFSEMPTYLLLNNYHNYLIHTLATTGFVGLGAFLYWLFTIIRKLFKKDDFNIIVLLIMFCMLLNGLVSTTFYEPIIMLIMLVVWANVPEIENKTKPSFQIYNPLIHL